MLKLIGTLGLLALMSSAVYAQEDDKQEQVEVDKVVIEKSDESNLSTKSEKVSQSDSASENQDEDKLSADVDNEDASSDDSWDDWDDDDWEDDDWGDEGAVEAKDEASEEVDEEDAKNTKEDETIDKSNLPWWQQIDFSAEIAPEIRWFTHKGLQNQHQFHSSIRVEPEFYYRFNDEKSSVTLVLFWRQDQHDTRRTHGDIREFVLTHAQDNWELKAGISKVFWGVAETRHLVDIINQTDLVENFDGEDKLGQPMVRFSYLSGFGTFDLFVLPYFRERTFPGANGRLRTPIVVEKDRVLYESSKGHRHLDWALRWFHTIGVWDIGLNFFRGTSREPRFSLQMLNADSILLPVYDIIEQYSTDIQATVGDWLWKCEAMVRRGQGSTFNAQVLGFEYTQVGVFDTDVDLGWLLEYHHDNRDPRMTLTPFNNDIAAGLRIALNDEKSTELLAFGLVDRHLNSRLYRIEASRRLTGNLKIEVEGTIFSNINTYDPLTFFRRDKFVQMELVYYL